MRYRRLMQPSFAADPRQFGLDPTGRVLVAASPLQRTMAVLAFPMMIAIPAWFVLGHVVLSGGGWMVLILGYLGVIVAGAMLVHAILATVHATKVLPFSAGRWSSRAGLAVCVLVAVFPLFVADFGDAGPSLPSSMTRWFGMSDAASGIMMMVCMTLLALVGVAMIVADGIELQRIVREHQQRNYAFAQAHAVGWR